MPLAAPLALLVAACGQVPPASGSSAAGTSMAQASPNRVAAHRTTAVDVLYAGSLTTIMEDQVGPAFDKATGDTFVGFAGGSKGLATDIKGGLRQADVFVSASPAVDRSLEGRANGNWVNGYTDLGTSPLVIGYNPSTRFAGALRRGPWYRVVAEPGFALGRTDPAVDPKGQLAVDALDAAAALYREPVLRADATTTRDVFPEESLVGRLQSGQLDAGFFYTVEASAAHFPYVGLPGFHYAATYTVARVNRAPHPAAATAFLSFLHSRTGTRLLTGDGLTVKG